MLEMRIKMKKQGSIVIALDPELAPLAIASMMELAAKGKYDGKEIQRLEPGFVIQPLFQDGLDPEIDRLIEPEFLTNPANHACTFQRGTVAMAGTEDQASGSQYFICLAPQERLNGNFTVIGHVIDGWEEIERLEKVEVTAHLDEESGRTYHVPKDPQVVEQVEIRA